MSALPDTWISIPTRYGSIATNSADSSPDGVSFVAAVNSTGTTTGWWATEVLTTPEAATAMLAELAGALSVETVHTDEYGLERHIPVPAGALRVCTHHSYIRVVDHHDNGIADGSAYWTIDEITEDPALVWGAILGAALS